MKKILFFISLFCVQFTVFANNPSEEETSRIILFLGRFHPLLLHLPIGALLITFYLDIVGRIKKNYPKATIKYALGFSAFFAIATSILGYFLSLEGGYDTTTLDLHFWLGISAAILISILFLVSRSEQSWAKKIYFPLFIVSLISLSVAGHYGSVLTHGDDFITKYAGPAPKQKIITQVDSLKLFDDVILKILDDKCIQCHNSTKRKGELSLISKEMILKGGENGAIIHKNHTDDSKLYTNAFLPLSDDLHMPPEGKPQLTKNELWILNYWINNELNFTAQIAHFKKNDTLHKLLKKYLVFEKIYIPPASMNAIYEVEKLGFSVQRLIPEKGGLRVKYVKTDLKKRTIKSLSNIKEQIIELDLSNSNLTDEMTGSLKKLENLKKLKLNNTKITDRSLANLKGLENLEFLNLYNTQISNTGLEKLLLSITPKNIYLWDTKVEDDFAKMLAKKHEINISLGVFKGFVENAALKKPRLMTKKTLFTDSIAIVLESDMKNTIIRYTLNGDEPTQTSTIYQNSIFINKSSELKAKAFKNNWLPSAVLSHYFTKIRFKITNFTIVDEPDKRYPKSAKLFDLEEGSDSFKDGKWTGFLGKDINTTIDFGEQKNITQVMVSCLEGFDNYILFPSQILVYASDSEKNGFKKIGAVKIKSNGPATVNILKKITVEIPNTKTRYLKVIIKNPKVLPATHPSAGEVPWIFVDEIIIW